MNERAKSQRESVLEFLRDWRSITPREALDYFGCFRLAPVIMRLKAQGHDIETTKEESNGAQYARYVLRGAK
jgi:t-SNARE complex subunit (syntaxin)